MNDPVAHCHGKEIYASKAAALEVRERMLRRSKAHRFPNKDKKRWVSGIEAYRCRTCNHWHLGNRDNGNFSK